MLAKRLDPIEHYKQRSYVSSPVYRTNLKRRKLSIHARFVASAFDIFSGASIVENIPVEQSQKCEENSSVSA